MRVTWVGSVSTDLVPEERRDELNKKLRQYKNLVPVFIEPAILAKYAAFCKVC